jgi:hypothetical protein
MKLSFSAAPQLLDEINRGSCGNVDLQVKYDYVKIALSLVCSVCAHREEIAWDTTVHEAVTICKSHKHAELDTTVRESVATIEYTTERKYKDMDEDV